VDVGEDLHVPRLEGHEIVKCALWVSPGTNRCFGANVPKCDGFVGFYNDVAVFSCYNAAKTNNRRSVPSFIPARLSELKVGTVPTDKPRWGGMQMVQPYRAVINIRIWRENAQN